MARHVRYYEFDQAAPIVCSNCGAEGSYDAWSEHYTISSTSPAASAALMLFIVGYPTIEDVREYAAKGHPEAIKTLPAAQQREDFLERLKNECLRSPDELPDLEGDGRLSFTWDFIEDEKADERWTLILVDGREIWREPAIYEGYHRFERVRDLLKAKYGDRFAGLDYTDRSALWLFD